LAVPPKLKLSTGIFLIVPASWVPPGKSVPKRLWLNFNDVLPIAGMFPVVKLPLNINPFDVIILGLGFILADAILNT